MGRQIQRAQGTVASRLWLSMLIEAMEEAARPELACERPVPAGLRLQLAQPGVDLSGRSVALQPAELTVRAPACVGPVVAGSCARIYSPAILSWGRLPCSRARSLASSRPI